MHLGHDLPIRSRAPVLPQGTALDRIERTQGSPLTSSTEARSESRPVPLSR